MVVFLMAVFLMAVLMAVLMVFVMAMILASGFLMAGYDEQMCRRAGTCYIWRVMKNSNNNHDNNAIR